MPDETVVKPTGADLLRAAADDMRAEIARDGAEPDPEETVVLAIFDAAAEAYAIDPSEPPRNPRDRNLLLAVLALADVGWNYFHPAPVDLEAL